MDERSDQEWVAQVRDGEGQVQRQAFLDLGRYVHRAVFNYLHSRRATLPRLRELDDQELEELARGFTQEALRIVWEKLPTYAGRGKFTSWAATIAIRAAGYELRKPYWKAKRLPLPLEDDLETSLSRPATSYQQWPDTRAVSPEMGVQTQEILSLVGSAVHEDLSARQRLAFITQFVEERTSDDIARELGTSRTAVYQLVHEARKKVKWRLLKAGYTLEDVLAIFCSPDAMQ